ncbi:hypothetical protein JNUCC1_02675 [Lentibacillus sp. JNUCC-1]|uniref:hypothetical protein n=1 Tax=Lentibacillus sp. JNUCC-1 TaxID=2654513 RepID=UPI0012E76D93|nr:hypothetical protein [Lentibacillus sp. JNUCC-1]MUV38804.1 hypothetical protein [Lentibacillus sp. JNUCC-1]
MAYIFGGLIFIFFKTNFSFWDIGVIYYITNFIGYVLILYGVNELGRSNQRILKVRPYAIFMIAHSMIVFLLNVTGHSPLTMAMSTTLQSIIALTGAVFVAAGMFMTFIIIFQLVEGLTGNMSEKLLENLITIMMLVFILAGITSILGLMPLLVSNIMGALLLLEVLFLIRYYYVFLGRNESHT